MEKKILVVSQWFARLQNGSIFIGGGTELQAFRIAKYFNETGHDLKVVVPDNFDEGIKEFYIENVPVRTFSQKNFGLRDIYSFIETIKSILEFKPHAVLVFGIGYHFAAGAILASKILRKKTVYYLALESIEDKKNMIYRLIDEFLFSAILNLADKIIYPSENTKQNAENKMKIKVQEKEEVIVGCVTSEIKKPEKIKIIKDSLLFVGRLSPEQKGIYVLLDSLKFVRKILPKTKCFFYFSQVEEKKLLELQNYCLKNNIEENVKFISVPLKHEEILRKYFEHEVFIMPSNYESFGIVLIEALKSGIPTICSDTEPLKTLSGNGKHCLLFKKGDKKDLAKKIILVLKNTKTKKELAAKALKVAKKFENKIVFKQIDKAILS